MVSRITEYSIDIHIVLESLGTKAELLFQSTDLLAWWLLYTHTHINCKILFKQNPLGMHIRKKSLRCTQHKCHTN